MMEVEGNTWEFSIFFFVQANYLCSGEEKHIQMKIGREG